MARSEARLSVEMWEDADFLKLSPLAQRAYMFLISQPDLAHSGVIPLRERRWARKSSGLTAAVLTENLRELEDTRFLVIDWDTEEVLVRSFVRRDRVFKQPNVLRAAVDHIPMIESKAILRSLAAETARIRAENDDLTTAQSDVLTDLENALAKRVVLELGASYERPPGNPSANPSVNPSAHPSANATPATPGERGDVERVSTDKEFPVSPLVRLPADSASPPLPGMAIAVAPAAEVTDPRTTNEIVAWWIERCDQRPAGEIIAQIGKKIKKLLEEGFQPAQICQGIAEWAGRDQHPSTLPSFVTNVANRRAPIRAAPPKVAPTDVRLAHNQAVAAQLRALEGTT